MVESKQKETWRLFWAKTDRGSDADPEWTRPLWAHLIDVANAALLLWEEVLPHTFKRTTAASLSLSEEETGRFLSFLIGLHDLGKAIPAFQSLHPPSFERLSHHLPTRPEYSKALRMHHGHASISIMLSRINALALDGSSKKSLEAAAAFVGFHHGKLCSLRTWREARALKKLGTKEWLLAQQELLSAVAKAWGVPDVPRFDAPHVVPAWMLTFAGWATLADWVGSMGTYYGDVDHQDDLNAYIPRSRGFAQKAIRGAGLDLGAGLSAPSFSEVFPWIPAPRDLQKVVSALGGPVQANPELLIIEAPTGEGKTEAALYRAARQQEGALGQGFYVAMPSQATSNMLFERLRKDFFPYAHPEGVANLRLIHGNDLLHDALDEMMVQATQVEQVFDDEGKPDPARTLAWFLPRKRGLLAPYGVGTVDQVFLGVLYARHFFLRLFGLTGKTVVFDEVHAYDHYMGTLFTHLLGWLRALGTHVIILSATLPSKTRNDLIRAWGAPVPKQDADLYPVVWQVTDHVQSLEVQPTPGREQIVAYQEASHEPEAVAALVKPFLDSGAAVAVICNTVARAQAIYERLQDELNPEDCILFHARYPFYIRSAIEDKVRTRLGMREEGGKRLPRPEGPALLVATQVAEQSLDFDVDVMVSDLAPVDLLLQRAGRLWRHALPYERPVDTPLFFTLVPNAEKALPMLDDVGGWIAREAYRTAIYDPIILWKTRATLKANEGWRLPEDYRPLIEAVYDGVLNPPTSLNDDDHKRWKAAADHLNKAKTYAKHYAQQRMIPTPTSLRELFKANHLELSEEDDADARVHADYRALTRQGGPSVEVICLHRHQGKLYLDPEGSLLFPLSDHEGIEPTKLSKDQLRPVLGASVRLSREDVLRELAEPSPAWEALSAANPILKQYRPLVFDQGVARIRDNLLVRYDATLGLQYVNPNKTT